MKMRDLLEFYTFVFECSACLAVAFSDTHRVGGKAFGAMWAGVSSIFP
jgi:hypothetical protein